MFKVIIAGGRTFADYELLKNKSDFILSKIKDSIQIVSGTADGADKLGEQYRKERGYSLQEFPAPWNEIEGKPLHQIGIRKDGKKYWKAAGHFRNAQMAEYADGLIAFWNGKSRGTQNMIELAKLQNIKVAVVRY